MNHNTRYTLQCPIPKTDYEHILLAHGGGGKLTKQLIDKMIYPLLGNEILEQGHDGAFLPSMEGDLAMTTDSFVVDPIFFPGGDIGELAVNGTVNDLVCCGAEPLYISLAFILEEGCPLDDLWKIIQSIASAAKSAGVQVVTGDTKVVEKGKGDKIYINTTGIGRVIAGMDISPDRCSEGDVVIINGTIGDHGIAIMTEREGLAFESTVKSDTVALNGMMMDLFSELPEIHVLRDPTRGGVASALNEICHSSGTGIRLIEDLLPVTGGVRGACEVMGLDPLYIANEGKILVIVPEKGAEKVISVMKKHEAGKESRIIGRVTREHPGILHLETCIGSTRIVDMISGEQLPRIC
ncbi:MAG: hydrogenase expression/formation protein HypE [Bacteroidales bacterium]|nr:hydrogenase expression/formation protein HypE [Bacteroidales bacterium]